MATGRFQKRTRASVPARTAKTVAAGATGAAVTYFLDPQSGKRRRNVARDRALAIIRRQAADAQRQARYAAGQAKGVVHQATPGGEDVSKLNDPALASKVETEIFRGDDVPKGSINVNAENGVIVLRGEVERHEQIEQLGAKAREVAGVSDVRNLLHLPGQAG